jgi:hypothetical protein
MNNQLIVKTENIGLSTEVRDDLANTFQPYLEKAEELKQKAMSIKITDINQIEDMQKAREARLTIRNIRIEVEKKRKSLKEESLRKGKAIDGMANVIKYLIGPIEEHLQKQENFAEEIRKQKEKERLDKRLLALAPYEVNTEFIDISGMPDDTFQIFLNNAKEQHEKKVAAEKEAERKRQEDENREKVRQERVNILLSMGLKFDGTNFTYRDVNFHHTEIITMDSDEFYQTSEKAKERIKQIEKEEKEEQDRIKAENERLKKEQEERDKKERQRKEAEEKERKRIEAENKAKVDAERKQREKAERELKERKEAEAKEKREAEEKAKREAEEKKRQEREMQLAPDKTKLHDFAVRVTQVELPDVKDPKAKAIVEQAVEYLNRTSSYIKKQMVGM